jgi:hypothetical protein
MTTTDAARGRFDTQRWLAPIVALLAIVPGAFGLLLFLAPEFSAKASGFVGKDIFLYRLAGAASFGYLVSLAGAWRDGWPALRITLAGMALFAAGSIVACAVALVAGEGTWIVGVVLVASVVFLGLQLLLLRNPPARTEWTRESLPDVADWVLYLIAFGAIAALGTGALALLFGGAGGTLLAGYSGTDSIIYREAGAATLGGAYGAYLALRSRRWAEIGRGLWGALAFNGLSLIAAVLEIARGSGGLNLLSVAILGVSLIVTAGVAVALRRGGQ